MAIQGGVLALRRRAAQGARVTRTRAAAAPEREVADLVRGRHGVLFCRKGWWGEQQGS